MYFTYFYGFYSFKIYIEETHRLVFVFSFGTQVSQTYVTTGLTSVIYSCSLEFLVNSLIFVFPCIIIYGFYYDQLDANCLVLFLLHYLLYMFRM